MRVLLLNPPHPIPLQRRFVASYYAPNFLIPPTELMALGAVVKAQGGEPLLVDAVAERLGSREVAERTRRFAPDLLVSMTGLGSFSADMEELARAKDAAGGAQLVVFGFLPTHRARETLEKTRADAVIRNEPEAPFAEVCARLASGADLAGVRGIAWRRGEEIVLEEDPGRAEDLDALPTPDYSLIDPRRYSESFLRGAIAPILSSRGCPHACTYCVRTYGKEVVYRSPESVLAEIEAAAARGIRRVRFMDDTFALNRRRCVRILEAILARNLDIEWSALTRVDGLDPELLALMRRSGCRRLYLGIESGSQRMLDLYKKGITLEDARRAAAAVREAGIESSGFFIVGAPEETEEDLAASIRFAKELRLDYVIVTRLQYWPGTDLFPAMAGRVNFSLVPTRIEVPGVRAYEDYFAWEKRFYRDFYLRPAYAARRLGTLFRAPGDVLTGLGRLVAYASADEARDFI